mmetsp:Transcript_1748/g.5237  ORF Transcript_1748/g.5237 Transcript_1748/m.5237 type:complete len:421 (-) Transcript_1748:293-1555(-)
MNYPGMMPGGLSPDSYINKSLRQLDAEHYSAAGLLLYRRTEEGTKLLLCRERPWNSFLSAYDPVALNVLGGKRVPRQERACHLTAVRCFLDAVGEVEDAPDAEGLSNMLNANSVFVLWYAMGKFALLVAEASQGSMSDLPEKFADGKQQAGPTEEFKVLPTGIKKYIKQIEAVEWVDVAQLVPSPQTEVTDLLSNILQVTGFKDFLEGNLDPATGFPDSGEPPAFTFDGGKDKGKSKGKSKGGKGKAGKGGSKDGKGWKGADGGYGKGADGGYGKGADGGYGAGCGMQMYPPAMGMGMQMKGIGMESKGVMGGNMYQGKGMPMYPAKGMAPPQAMAPAPPMMYPPQFDQSSTELQRQYYGEQLFLLVQPMASSPYMAQKITGMLLELPHNELMINISNREELHRRISEALEVLKEDGVVA